MKFKEDSSRLLQQFDMKLHAKAREVAQRFDLFCQSRGFGHAIVTDIGRAPEFYKSRGLKVPLFSWHYVHCAVDFRNLHLLYAQQAECEAWLRAECAGSEWELVLTTHGTGPHWHVAFRDFVRRKAYTLANPPTLTKGKS